MICIKISNNQASYRKIDNQDGDMNPQSQFQICSSTGQEINEKILDQFKIKEFKKQSSKQSKKSSTQVQNFLSLDQQLGSDEKSHQNHVFYQLIVQMQCYMNKQNISLQYISQNNNSNISSKKNSIEEENQSQQLSNSPNNISNNSQKQKNINIESFNYKETFNKIIKIYNQNENLLSILRVLILPLIKSQLDNMSSYDYKLHQVIYQKLFEKQQLSMINQIKKKIAKQFKLIIIQIQKQNTQSINLLNKKSGDIQLQGIGQTQYVHQMLTRNEKILNKYSDLIFKFSNGLDQQRL